MEIKYIEQHIDKEAPMFTLHCSLPELQHYVPYFDKLLDHTKINKTLNQQGFMSLLDDTTNTAYRIEVV